MITRPRSARQNIVPGDSSRLGGAGWDLFQITVNAEAVPSIFAGELSDTLDFQALTTSRVSGDMTGIVDPNADVTWSVWHRTLSGTHPWRMVVRRLDGNTVVLPVTSTTTPTLSELALNMMTGLSVPQCRIQNDTSAPVGTIVVDHVQFEPVPVSEVNRASARIRAVGASPRPRAAGLAFGGPQ